MFSSPGRLPIHLLAPVVGALLISAAGVAQQTEPGANPEVTRQPPATPQSPPPAKVVRSKPRGRLPAYFAAVVSQEQRGQIYGIQAQYNDKISALRMQIDQLLAQRDKAVDGVLTSQQLADVNKKRQAAAARRRGNRSSPADAAKEEGVTDK